MHAEPPIVNTATSQPVQPPSILQPSATPPVSQRTRSHKPSIPDSLLVSPTPLQSQARALPFSPVAGRTRRKIFQKYNTHFSPYPSCKPAAPISPYRHHRQIPQNQTALLSPYASPQAIAGAIRKRHTTQHSVTIKFPSAESHPHLLTAYDNCSQKSFSTHRRKKAKPY